MSAAVRLRIGLPSGIDAEPLVDLLSAVGAVVEQSGNQLTARFGETQPDYLEDRVESWLRLIDPAGDATLASAQGDGAWQEGWRGVYAGIDVGRFRIRPPWAPAPADGVLLRIDPRGGFGSGLHPTTRLMLELLDGWVDQFCGGTALDVGAGLGVLSLAVASCGLRPTALERVPASLLACRAAAQANGLDFPATDAPLEQLVGRFTLVLGNLPPSTLRRLLPGMWRRVAPGGALLVAGADRALLEHYLGELALPPLELRLLDRGEWAAAAVAKGLDGSARVVPGAL